MSIVKWNLRHRIYSLIPPMPWLRCRHLAWELSVTEMRLQKRPRQQQQPLDSEFFWTSGFINNQVANRKSIVLKHRDHKISDPKPPLSQSSSKKEWFGLARLGLLGESFGRSVSTTPRIQTKRAVLAAPLAKSSCCLWRSWHGAESIFAGVPKQLCFNCHGTSCREVPNLSPQGWKHQDDAARPHEASAFFLQLHWESEAPGWQCEVSSCCFTKYGWQWILVVLKLFTRLRDQLQAHVAWACSMSSAAKLISPNLRVHHQQRPVLLQNQAMFPSGQAPALQHPGARHMRGIHGKVQTNDQVQSVPQALPLRQPSASAAAIQSGLGVLSRTNKPNKKHTLCKWEIVGV